MRRVNISIQVGGFSWFNGRGQGRKRMDFVLRDEFELVLMDGFVLLSVVRIKDHQAVEIGVFDRECVSWSRDTNWEGIRTEFKCYKIRA